MLWVRRLPAIAALVHFGQGRRRPVPDAWLAGSRVPGPPGMPEVVSLLPASGTGISGSFTAVFTHGTAASELYLGYILFLPVPNIVWHTAKRSYLIE